MKLSDKLEEITRKFWMAWRTWRLGQGWSLGIDMPSQKVSPHLVANFDQLTPDGSEWFRQHTALMLWAMEDLPLEAWGLVPKAVPPPVVEGAEPRLRVEVEKLRLENNEIRRRYAALELERNQEVQKADVERSLRSKLETDTTELTGAVGPAVKAVEAALKALKGRDTVRVAGNLVKALTLLTGGPVEPEEVEPEETEPEEPPPQPKRPQKPKAEPKAKKKQPDWG